MLFKILQKFAEEVKLPNSFYDVTFILIPKPEKDINKKEKITDNITDEHRCKNPQQNSNKYYPKTHCLGLVHWDDPEGWNGEGGGFRMGNTCIPVADYF